MTEPITAIMACQTDPSILASWRAAVEKAAPGSQFLTETEPTTKLGESLRGLFPAVEQSTVLVVLPDIRYHPGEVQTLLKAAKNADVVVGVRQGQPRPKWLARIGWFGRLLARVLFGVTLDANTPWYGWDVVRRRLRLRWKFGLRLKDPESGLLLIRREVWAQCPTQSNGRFAVVELLAKANFAGAVMAEVELGPTGKSTPPPLESDAKDESMIFRKPTFLPPLAEGCA